MRAAALTCIAALLCLPTAARADGDGDGVYGRFDDSLVLALGAGGGVMTGAGEVLGTAQVEARLRILHSAGPVVSGSIVPTRGGRLFLGIEVRPLFPGLFLVDMSTGHEWLDLFLGSIGLELGAGLAFDDVVTVGFAWGLAVELPLLSPARFAQGLALRLAARRFRGERRAFDAPNRGEDEWSSTASLVVGVGLGSASARWEPDRYVR